MRVLPGIGVSIFDIVEPHQSTTPLFIEKFYEEFIMGSGRKVRMVLNEAKAAGVPAERLADVYAPLGLDVRAETPAEIVVRVLA